MQYVEILTPPEKIFEGYFMNFSKSSKNHILYPKMIFTKGAQNFCHLAKVLPEAGNNTFCIPERPGYSHENNLIKFHFCDSFKIFMVVFLATAQVMGIC